LNGFGIKKFFTHLKSVLGLGIRVEQLVNNDHPRDSKNNGHYRQAAVAIQVQTAFKQRLKG
jgi:hypothetical protein